MNSSTSRSCTRCGTVVPNEDQCPTCLAEFATRRNVSQMTTEERLAEFNSWFLAGRVPEISNDRVAIRVAELVGHHVHPFDLVTSEGLDDLRRQIVTGGDAE